MPSAVPAPASPPWPRAPRRPAWLSPKVLRTEVLGGLVVALALIPEAISFSVIAGVDPAIGLFSSFTMAVTIAVFGGRPAMISAATGAVALVIAPLNREHGFGYLVAAVILAGVFQIVLGALGVARLLRFVPPAVMAGFVNALAILVFLAQLTELRDVPWPVYPLVAAGLALLVLLPKLTSVVPAPLVSIAVLTAFTLAAGIAVPTVGDKGELPTGLPVPGLPDVPFTLETLATIAPYAFAMALVGLMESLMTAKLVDEITGTPSGKTRESVGQGVANIVTGFLGGMGGCAMIGQTMINVKVSGARTRLSTFLAGVFLMVLCIVCGPVVSRIPMAALVAVMVMVCFATFDWRSVAPRVLRRTPAAETVVMALTVACVVATHNLAVGVVAGTLTAIALTRLRNRGRTSGAPAPSPAPESAPESARKAPAPTAR
ncbi:SulP family inorganic anion transporter [Streptomyces xanthophaeus]|uniref:SulP family inorganic anion transporter n=1 Tax=Streptomyces xanthophaeus TaxID=67385 RepID=UPI00099C4E12|nr:SulP family inorganic anion transporter [Streptomyces xanthophaeus]